MLFFPDVTVLGIIPLKLWSIWEAISWPKRKCFEHSLFGHDIAIQIKKWEVPFLCVNIPRTDKYFHTCLHMLVPSAVLQYAKSRQLPSIDLKSFLSGSKNSFVLVVRSATLYVAYQGWKRKNPRIGSTSRHLLYKKLSFFDVAWRTFIVIFLSDATAIIQSSFCKVN